jgi:hypothetical protein
VAEALPDFGEATIGQLLRLLLKRRRKPRYDAASDSLVFDGPVQATVSLDTLLDAVRDD